jgi:succinyl-diaminopimelate desuccinylase
MAELDLAADVVTLTEALCNVESVSHNEAHLCDLLETELRKLEHLEVTRVDHNLVARTSFGRAERVVLAGHLDTVPLNENLPVRNDGTNLHGLGTCDMKGGLACLLKLAHDLEHPKRDLTFIAYEAEEVADEFNGLGKLARLRPDLLEADFAILLEPSNADIEAGCQGTLRVEVSTSGERAHSARSWRGDNAIHKVEEILRRLNSYEPRKPVIAGLEYHEGLNAVLIQGGVATNVIPDACVVTINYRFAPDRDEVEALAHMKEVFSGFRVEVTDSAPGALPGLDLPAAQEFVKATGGQPSPKFGWTDVARFSAMGVPAINFGPGDPNFAHKQDEFVPIEDLRQCEQALRKWLEG